MKLFRYQLFTAPTLLIDVAISFTFSILARADIRLIFHTIKPPQSLLCALLCLLALAPISCGAESLKVVVLLSDNSAPYQSFVNTLNKNLPTSVQVTVLEHPEQLPSEVQQSELILAVGMKATEIAAAQTSIPVLAVMVPQAKYEEMLAQPSLKKSIRSISAIYINQPWNRQLDFLSAALPKRQKIGLLYSPSTRMAVSRLSQDIVNRGASHNAQQIRSTDELFSQLEAVLEKSDVLMAIPDNMIYSAGNAQNILMTSFNHEVPVVGLSQAYVNAGALCAIFSKPEQMAEQASVVVVAFARTGILPEPQYPDQFTIAVNQRVARSLAIEISSPEAIRARMEN